MINYWLESLSPAHRQRVEEWGQRGLVLLAVGLFIGLGTGAIAFQSLLQSQTILQLQVEEVAPRDVLAPRSLTFTSPIKTEEARQLAIASIVPIYDPDPDVTRSQIRYARAVTTYVNEVRHDPYASLDQKVEDLLLIEAITLNESIWVTVLETSDVRWDLMSNEIVALTEQTMQRDIRADNLDSVRSSLINRVASRFTNSEAETIVIVVRDMIQPNSILNEDRTRTLQADLAATVPLQERTFEKGQLIIRSGNLVTAADLEALEQFGLLNRGRLQIRIILGALLAMLTATAIVWLYLDRFHHSLLHEPRLLILMAILFLIFLGSVNFFGEAGANQPYLYPAAAMGLLLTSLFSTQLAMLSVAILAVLVSLTFSNENLALAMLAYVLFSGFAGILTMKHINHLNSYFISGLTISLTNILTIWVFALFAEEGVTVAQGVLRSTLGLANGLFAAGIAIVGLYVITAVTNLPTSLKLIDLMDSKQQLLQKLLREAPGTYQHSLQVANLCELAAEAIQADTHLIRVAAMYHDIGKTALPFFFGENTPDGVSPHRELNDPVKSAKIIIGHVIEGDKMACKAKLPERIRDFIREHHGTTQALFFYNQAVDQAGGNLEQVNIQEFTYPGPQPRSRETAIMMLADGCESATRSARPNSKDDVEKMVNTIFELRLSEGQLDQSGLTLHDLKVIRETFIETLQAIYHPRIAYQNQHQVVAMGDKSITYGFVKHLEKSPAKKNALDPDQKNQLQAAIDGAVTSGRKPEIIKDKRNETPTNEPI